MAEQIISVPDVSQEQAELNKPAIEPGTYLAVVTKVEPYTNPVKQSYGLNWYLLINTNPDISEGWDAEARVVPQKYYTYIGKFENGKLKKAEKTYNLSNMLGAFDLSGDFAPSQVLHRQVIVTTALTPSMQDKEALEANPQHEVQRYYPEVKTSRPYIVDGVKGPVLQNLAESAEASEPTTTDSGGEF